MEGWGDNDVKGSGGVIRCMLGWEGTIEEWVGE
jgi:hypothetical protein